jgi:hypothetical protein
MAPQPAFYVNNIVLPLLGLDLGCGIEGHSPELYFEVGLTDFWFDAAW